MYYMYYMIYIISTLIFHCVIVPVIRPVKVFSDFCHIFSLERKQKQYLQQPKFLCIPNAHRN